MRKDLEMSKMNIGWVRNLINIVMLHHVFATVLL